jgi:hypothetical protein
MATQYSNKPIVLDGLVYALDFGNQKSYVSGSSVARSLNFVPYVSPLVTFSGAPIPTLTPNGIQFTNNFTVDTGNPFSVVSDSRAFTMMYTVRVSGNGLFATKDNGNQSSLHSVLNTNLGVVGWRYYNANIFNQRQYSFTPSTINHHTWTYSSGSYTYYINGIPVTGSDSATGGGVSLTWNLYLSGRSAAPDQFWSGSLFNFYLYDRVLTADEIYSNYLITAQRIGLSTRPKPYTVDPDVYNFLTATNITDGIITSSLDTFVRGLKSASLWDKMIAIYPFVGTGSVGTNLTGSHRWNLKEATVLTSSFNGSWNGSTSGSTPSGSNTFISVPLSPTRPTLGSWTYPNYSSSNVHISILSYDTPVSRSYLMGTGMTEDLAVSTLAGDYGTPAAAYSVRKVRTAYTGALMDVRRSIDNVTSSIGFVSNGDLDTGSLLNFVRTEGNNFLPGAYSGLAAAYSLRRVSASYAGSAIDVRRIWDNTTSSIGFDINGNLDTVSLLNFTTSGSNVLPYSNDFTQADWAKYDVQVTASSILGPYGLGSGSFINETSTNSYHTFNENINPVNTSSIHTISCFVKKQERRYVGLSFAYSGGANSYVIFDLDTTSSVSSGSSSTGYSVISTSIKYVTDGWFRISLVGTVGLSDFYPRFYLSNTPTGYSPSYVGEPGTGSYIYGFQYTTGSTVQPYIETTGTARYNVGNTSSFGYVTQWYDQSGNNRHATQTTSSSQPLIVSSGSLIRDLGNYPSILFQASRQTNLNASSASIPQDSNFAIVSLTDSITNTTVAYQGFRSSGYNILYLYPTLFGSTTSRFNYRLPELAGGSFDVTSPSSLRVLNTAYRSGTTFGITRNGNLNTTTQTISENMATFYIGNSGSDHFNGRFTELLIYHSDQSTNRPLIENNINNYYNIYTGSNHGFVARWYDQSGNNRHATQTTTGSQPVIVESGSILNINSRPSLKFDGVNDSLVVPSYRPTTNVIAVESVQRINSASGVSVLVNETGGPLYLQWVNTPSTFANYYGGITNTTFSSNQLLQSFYMQSGGGGFFQNGISTVSNAQGGSGASSLDLRIGGFDGSSLFSDSNHQELVIYQTAQSSNRQAIQYGINNYYNIYPQTSSFATSSFTISAASGSVSASLNNRLTSGIVSSGPLGLITVSRTGSNSLTIARNGVTSSFAVPASGALSTGIYLGAINNNSIALGNSPLNLSFASVGTGLTGNDLTTYYRLVGDLQNNLNRPDLDATAFIGALGTLTLTQQQAVDTLVKDLKRFSLWDKTIAIYPFIGGTADTHKYNLKDPRDLDAAYRLSFSGTWTHNASGSQPSNARANSYIIPTTALERDSVHMSFYTPTSTLSDMADWAAQFNNFYFTPALVSGQLYVAFNNGENNTGTTPYPVSGGFKLGTRINSGTVNFYNNNSQIKSVSVGLNAYTSTQTLLLGGFSDGRYSSTRMYSFGTVGVGLTATDVANLYTAIQKFQTTLGRQV